jgi:prophage regulatory protein
MNETYLSDTDLAQRFHLSRQTIWRWHRTNPGFPRAISLSAGCTRWKLSSIEAWEQETMKAS